MHRITPYYWFAEKPVGGCQVQEEQDLVRRAQQKDAEAFAQLYETYFDKIYRYILLKIGRQSEAEDLTQQVFLNAFQSLASYKQRGVPFSSWLFRIAHNQAVDYLRKASREKSFSLEDERARIEVDPASLAEQKLSLEQLLGTFSALSPAQQEVLRLRFVAELTVAEVAQAMGKNEGAIKALQHSALAKLRQILREKDKEETSG